MKRGRELTPTSRKLLRAAVHLFVWAGVAVMYYFTFALLFDTPAEYRLKSSTARLRQEYDALNARYDSLTEVLANVSERDRNVFRVLFESDPYGFEDLLPDEEWTSYEMLTGKSNRELAVEFFDKLKGFGDDVSHLYGAYTRIRNGVEQLGDKAGNIPSIQPVVNHGLTMLAASFGLRIHPFYRTLMPHGGVDYTAPEGTPVFATADGTVRDVSSRSTGSGLTVVVNHGNGYETTYSHLGRSDVHKGDAVHRGDIIARTGDTGMSFGPHLHYEVRKDGLRVDPIHYFFMELSPKDYQRIIRIAGSGMQSFD